MSEPEAVAAKAEDNKVSKYCNLDACYQFVPVETCSTFGPQAGEFFRELGRHPQPSPHLTPASEEGYS